MPSPTYTLINSVTVGGGGAASIDFTAIPATYTDLVVKVSTRQNGNADGYQIGITFNGSASGYSRKVLYGYGTGVASAGGSSETFARIAFAESSTYTASTFNNFEIYIPNYTSSNQKSFSSDAVSENNATAVYSQSLHAGLWSGTTSISSLSISEASGSGTNFVQYSTAYLYGVKNA